MKAAVLEEEQEVEEAEAPIAESFLIQAVMETGKENTTLEFIIITSLQEKMASPILLDHTKKRIGRVLQIVEMMTLLTIGLV